MGQELAHTMQRSTIEDIILFMKTSLADSITINTLTRQFGISSTHLTREFRKYTGSSPKDYLNHLRINEAKRLLKETHHPAAIPKIFGLINNANLPIHSF